MKTVLCALSVIAVWIGVTGCASQSPGMQPHTLARSLEAFSGTWEITAVQPPGSTKQAKRLVFREDRTYAALDADGTELWAGTFDLDPTTTPRIWDHRSDESRKNGGDALGIYELDGDKLKLCCVVGTWEDTRWTGKARPAEFKLPAAEVVLDLRRVTTDAAD